MVLYLIQSGDLLALRLAANPHARLLRLRETMPRKTPLDLRCFATVARPRTTQRHLYARFAPGWRVGQWVHLNSEKRRGLQWALAEAAIDPPAHATVHPTEASRHARERLLGAFLAFLDGKSDPPAPGTLRDGLGFPVLKVCAPCWTPIARLDGERLMSLLMTDPFTATAQLNAGGGVLMTCYADLTQPDALRYPVPSVGTPAELVRAMVLLALTTPTRQGDPLAHRIARCGDCQSWFLRRSRKAVAERCGECKKQKRPGFPRRSVCTEGAIGRGGRGPTYRGSSRT